jgi:hypothetical protein
MSKSSPLLLEITSGLPRVPIEAIAVVADRAHQRILTPSQSVGTDEDYIAIVAFLDRFSKKFGIDIRFPKIGSDANNYQKLAIYVNAVRSLGVNAVEEDVSIEIDNLIAKFEGKSDSSFGLARLNDEEKKKILQHLEKARKIVEESQLSDRKKNALFERLADLIREVNTHGTRTDRFFALAGDIGFVLGEMAEKGKPFFTEVREILKIITRARARQEGVSLPPGDEVLKLPSPSDFGTGEE